MNFSFQIVLHSKFDRAMSEASRLDMLSNVMDYFVSHIESNDEIEHVYSSLFMLEGNQNITLDIKAKFKSEMKTKEKKEMILSFVPESLNDIVTFDVEKTTVNIVIDSKKNLLDSDNPAILTSLDLIPKEVKEIELMGYYPEFSTDEPVLEVLFNDELGNNVEVKEPWVQELINKYAKTFTASDVYDLKLSYLIRLLIGKTPSEDVANAINKTLMITTPYMEDNVAPEECELMMDFD